MATTAKAGAPEYWMVDDHHGDAMHRDGYAILAVYGTPLSGHLRHALSAFGFSEFVSTTEGFRAIKRDTG